MPSPHPLNLSKVNEGLEAYKSTAKSIAPLTPESSEFSAKEDFLLRTGQDPNYFAEVRSWITADEYWWVEDKHFRVTVFLLSSFEGIPSTTALKAAFDKYQQAEDRARLLGEAPHNRTLPISTGSSSDLRERAKKGSRARTRKAKNLKRNLVTSEVAEGPTISRIEKAGTMRKRKSNRGIEVEKSPVRRSKRLESKLRPLLATR